MQCDNTFFRSQTYVYKFQKEARRLNFHNLNANLCEF